MSGFWYIFRKIEKDSSGNTILQQYNNNIPKQLDNFISGTSFSDVIDLYIFDKKLRLMMLDAIERIEIFIRSIIAYEMGKSSPMAYEDSSYIDPYYLIKNDGKSKWDHWQSENSGHICRSHEDYILRVLTG